MLLGALILVFFVVPIHGTTFEASDIDSSAGAQSVFAIDLDGDGHADVLTGDAATNTIAWYKGDGSGRFDTARVVSDSATGVFSVFAIDLDRDTEIDVLFAGGTTVGWFKNDGSGGFDPQPDLITTLADARSVFAIDLNGDDYIDVLSASSGDDTIMRYMNNGAVGGFGAGQVVTDQALGAFAVYAATLDSDALPDILSASSFDNTIGWYHNQHDVHGQGSDMFTPRIVITDTALNAGSVSAFDMDRDGDLDVVYAAFGGDKVAWVENGLGSPSGSFGSEIVISDSLAGPISIFPTDLDGDTYPDILVASISDDSISWFRNDRFGGFQDQQVISDSANAPNSVFAIDLNGNGHADVISGSFDAISMFDNIPPGDGGGFETAPPAVYYNDGLAGTGTPVINNPTIVVLFEHDDITDLTSFFPVPYGSVEVTHYKAGCVTEIVAPFGSSAIGELVTDVSNDFSASATGFPAQHIAIIEDSARTVIQYPLALLDTNADITEEILGTITTKFCVRLSVYDDDGDEFGFREVDITVTHTKDSVADVNLVTAEDETNESFDQGLGDYSVGAFFCDPSNIPATVVTPGPTTALTALNQGEEFTICLRPELGVDTPTSDVDIKEVETCVFWVDTNPNLLVDAGETSVVAIDDGAAVDTVTTDLTYGDGFLVDATPTVSGAHFTITLPPSFYVPIGEGTGTTVRGLCTVMLEFQGGIVRRHVQEVGDVGEVSTTTELAINFEGVVAEEEEESCMDGCFFIMCVIRFIMCFMQGLFA